MYESIHNPYVLRFELNVIFIDLKNKPFQLSHEIKNIHWSKMS